MILFRLLLLATALSAVPCAAQPLWQIGKSDNNYAEFAIARNNEAYSGQFADGVVVDAGDADAAAHWPYVQPGPADAWAGSKQHTHTINFDLTPEPGAIYALIIDLVDAHAFLPPHIVVRVNSSERAFDLNPGTSDLSLTDPNKSREQVLRMYLRAEWLKASNNTISITNTSGSWMLYDCISFARRAEPPKAAENLSLQSTFLFKKSGDELRQVIKATMDLWEDQPRILARLEGDAGLRVEQVFENVPCGRSSLDIEIPPDTKPQHAVLHVSIGSEDFETHGDIVIHRPWRVYLMPSTHFDIGYTSIQERALQTHRENIDRAIEWCAKYPDFVWNSECSYIAKDYLENGAHKEEFLRLAKEGRLGVMAFFGNELTGICSAESLTRLMDYYDYLRKVHGIESNCAMMSDVPSMVSSIPMVLAGHGIKYLSHGINATRARADQEMCDMLHYWESPDGSRVLTWKTWGYGKCDFAIRRNLEETCSALNNMLGAYEGRADYPYDAVLLHGGYGDNQPSSELLPRLAAEWNRTYEYPKLIFCRGSEFFEYVESKFAEQIPVLKGDGGVWWEDGAASSAYETGIVRDAKERLIVAEKLVSLCDSKERKRILPHIEKAWENVLLYDEHTWGAAQSIDAPDSAETLGQWAVKKSFADKAYEDALAVEKSTWKAACGLFDAPEGSVVVFNPTNAARTEVHTFDHDGWYDITADAVPAMGCKVYPLPADPVEDSDIANTTEPALENSYYRIRFDKNTGAVISIFDKELQRELIDSSTYGANAYLHVTGGEGSRLLHCDFSLPPPELTITQPSGMSYMIAQVGSAQMISFRQKSEPGSLSGRVMLYDDRKRIDFVNYINKKRNLGKESGYFAFPFAFEKPEIRLETPGAVIRADADQIKGACRDWHCVDGFVTVSDGSAEVVWAPRQSPLITIGDINRGQWRERLDISNGTLFAYVFNNYWFTNYKADQEGMLPFVFSITSGTSFTDSEARRFAENARTPMLSAMASAQIADRPRLPVGASLVEVDAKNVLVQAVRPARFTDGTIIRLREMDGQSGTAKLTLRGIPFRRAQLCNLAEDVILELPHKDGVIEVPYKALGLVTVLVE